MGPPTTLSYLFVVTYGRSGSTLLQGLLNTIPGYLIRGENGDAVYHLFRFHQTMVTERDRRDPVRTRSQRHPFFGVCDFPDAASLAGIRQLVLDTVLRPTPATRVTGFKEIRWYQEDLEDYVGFLAEVFPSARFVVNTRNQADVLKSKWWAKKDNTAYLAAVEERLLRLRDSLGPACYHVHYDDYVADPAVLRGLFDWLGEDFDMATVTATLGVHHSV